MSVRHTDRTGAPPASPRHTHRCCSGAFPEVRLASVRFGSGESVLFSRLCLLTAGFDDPGAAQSSAHTHEYTQYGLTLSAAMVMMKQPQRACAHHHRNLNASTCVTQLKRRWGATPTFINVTGTFPNALITTITSKVKRNHVSVMSSLSKMGALMRKKEHFFEVLMT